MAEKILIVNQQACTGCMSCMEACSLAHGSGSSYRLSRIKVAANKQEAVFVPLVCEMCYGRCVEVCPVQAIEFDAGLGTPLIDAEACTGCGTCVEECPFEGIGFDPREERALKCDLCGGEPVCAQVCQAGALIAVEPSGVELNRKYQAAGAKMAVLKDQIQAVKAGYLQQAEGE